MNKATILLLLTITSCMAFESKVLDEYISQGYDILEHPFGNFQAKVFLNFFEYFFKDNKISINSL